MTPADHIAEAERLVGRIQDGYGDGPLGNPEEDALLAVAHALIALAVENGVPHAAPPATGGSGGS